MAETTSRPRRVAIYTRISRDDEGRALGVQRQEDDCRALCARNGWLVVAVFTDNDIGASTLSKKPRPEFIKMIKGVESGEFDTIVAYSNSRLTRRPLELENMIQLHRSTGVLICTVASGSDDLSTADGRMVARIKADVDAAEAERTSERSKRALAERVKNGVTHNGFPRFGYRYDKQAKIYKQHPEEAEAIRVAYDDVLAGVTFQAIADRWNQAGLLGASGNRWSPTTVRRTLESGFPGGLIRAKSKPDNSTTRLATYDRWWPGSHEPIITKATWEKFRAWRLAIDTVPARLRSGVHALSGLLRCWCGQNMSAGGSNGRRIYYCPAARDYKAHKQFSISAARAEAAVLDWLTRVTESGFDVTEEAQRLISQSKIAARRVAEIDGQIAEQLARKTQAGQDFMGKMITAGKAEEIGDEVDACVAALEAAKRDVASALPVNPADRIREFTTLRQEWPNFSPGGRRVALMALVEHFEVVPPSAGRRLSTVHAKERFV